MTVSVLLEAILSKGRGMASLPFDGKIQADKDVQWIPKNRFNLNVEDAIGSSLNCDILKEDYQKYLQFRQDDGSG